MDKALAYGARDCGFKSHCVLIFFFNMEDQEDISADYVLSLFQSLNDNILVTDEDSACEYAGITVSTVLSNYENIKVTYAEDMELIDIFKKKFF